MGLVPCFLLIEKFNTDKKTVLPEKAMSDRSVIKFQSGDVFLAKSKQCWVTTYFKVCIPVSNFLCPCISVDTRICVVECQMIQTDIAQGRGCYWSSPNENWVARIHQAQVLFCESFMLLEQQIFMLFLRLILICPPPTISSCAHSCPDKHNLHGSTEGQRSIICRFFTGNTVSQFCGNVCSKSGSGRKHRDSQIDKLAKKKSKRLHVFTFSLLRFSNEKAFSPSDVPWFFFWLLVRKKFLVSSSVSFENEIFSYLYDCTSGMTAWFNYYVRFSLYKWTFLLLCQIENWKCDIYKNVYFSFLFLSHH